MSDDEEQEVDCPFSCVSQDENRVARSYGLFVAAMEADQRGDIEAFKLICESADAYDYHIASHAYMDLLNYFAEAGLVDAPASLIAYRERVNGWLAET